MSKTAYSYEEKELLVQILKQHPIIECKESNATTIKNKSRAWESVCNEYNSSVTGEKRSVIQLKRCWDKIKRQRKEGLASERRSQMATGGGPSTNILPDNFIPDVDTVAPHLSTEIENVLDSDALYLTKIDTEDDKERSRSPQFRTAQPESSATKKTTKSCSTNLSTNRSKSVDRLMTQRLRNAESEQKNLQELHDIRMEIEKQHLERAKIDTEIGRVELEIKKKQLSLL